MPPNSCRSRGRRLGFAPRRAAGAGPGAPRGFPCPEPLSVISVPEQPNRIFLRPPQRDFNPQTIASSSGTRSPRLGCENALGSRAGSSLDGTELRAHPRAGTERLRPLSAPAEPCRARGARPGPAAPSGSRTCRYLKTRQQSPPGGCKELHCGFLLLGRSRNPTAAQSPVTPPGRLQTAF